MVVGAVQMIGASSLAVKVLQVRQARLFRPIGAGWCWLRMAADAQDGWGCFWL
jgi:hypothetical protein